MAYIGKSPTGTGVRSRFHFTATGSETSLSGADDNGKTLVFADGEYVDVYLNGVLLFDGDYNTTTANTIGGLSALTASDVVEIVVYDIFSVADTVSAKNGGTFSGDVTVNGDLTVDTDAFHVDSSNDRVGIGTSSPSSLLHVEDSSTGAVIARVKNSSNTSGAHSRIIVQNGGGSGGDSLINFDAQASGSRFTIGADRSAGKFVIANADKGSFDGSNEIMTIGGSSGRYIQMYQTDGNERFRFDLNTGKLWFDGEGGSNASVDVRQGSAKVWATIQQEDSNTTHDSYNMSSFTDGGTGKVQVNINNDFNNDDYAVSIGAEDGTGENDLRACHRDLGLSRTAGTYGYLTIAGNAAKNDYARSCPIFHGDLA